MHKKCFLLTVAVIAFSFFSTLVLAETSLPPKKQTSLGLYITAKDAYSKWAENPEEVKIVDVRTPGEYVFVGHAPMAYNVPSKFLLNGFDASTKKTAMKDNPDFLNLVKEKFNTSATIMMMCRSGGRSSKAVNALASAGYNNVYSITDGFEGDKINDTQSPLSGKRLKNGWKNSGSPWTYDLDPELMYINVTEN